jgi:DnaJ-domain-containing protein 1
MHPKKERRNMRKEEKDRVIMKAERQNVPKKYMTEINEETKQIKDKVKKRRAEEKMQHTKKVAGRN